MNVLVTGATGFLGGRLVEALVRDTEIKTIVAAGRTLRPHATVIHEKVRYALGELSDPRYTETLFDDPPEVVVNCASLSAPWYAWQDFEEANLKTQRHLIAVSKQHNVRRFVYISTPSMYTTGRDRRYVKESDPLPKKLVNYYAQTKYAAEQMLQAASLPHIILRPRALLGRGDSVIMPRVIRSYEEGRLRVIGNGKTVVDMTAVSNVVQAIRLAMSAPDEACGEVYNITNGEPIALWEAVSYTLHKLGLEPPTRKIPFVVAYAVAGIMEWRARRITHQEPVFTRYTVSTLANTMTLDITKARERLGYQPQQTVYSAIDEFVAWYEKASHDKG
ncbi:MAG TPA: sterol-4-alpha-carboxylate 3-dehydrogenase [Cytophagales bacterium]|nr:sterol-4-alpha-carboxylate 3-dehydrogenase [Cytophagales bacterium]